MAVSAGDVKELRDRTGAGFLDCKKALEETGGNLDKAVEVLQKKALVSAGKKQSRIAAEGLVHSYIHAGGKVGVLLELNCETDFVARSDDFQQLVHDLAMHIAWANPTVVRAEELDPAEVAKQREIFKAQAMGEGKPEAIAEKIVEGRLKKWHKEIVLLEQPFAKDEERTVADLVTGLSAKIGEKLSVRRFTRWQVGEGLEKRTDDFASEVARQAGLQPSAP
jgi:elongation factor Ts